MNVALNNAVPLYAGTTLTLTCTVTLDPNVDSRVYVRTEWSGPIEISGERYSITNAHVSGRTNTYTGSLTISPLADQDGGTYICTATVTGGTYVQQSTGSDDYVIPIISKSPYMPYSACIRLFFLLQKYFMQMLARQCSNQLHWLLCGISVKECLATPFPTTIPTLSASLTHILALILVIMR